MIKDDETVQFGTDPSLHMFEVRSVGNRLDVNLVYPRIRGRGQPVEVHIELDDVRAADALIVRYDYERDGWSIRMDRTKDLGSMMEVVEPNVEVAFVPAWNEVDE